MPTISMLYVTFPDEETAVKIGNILLVEKWIACINLHPILSHYTWNQKTETGNEIVGTIKTLPVIIECCIKRIEELHPYDTPCILHTEWVANEAYYLWVFEVTRRKEE
jgi:periplasmic divalent cation tolerance protein